jgi:hypothetical protein
MTHVHLHTKVNKTSTCFALPFRTTFFFKYNRLLGPMRRKPIEEVAVVFSYALRRHMTFLREKNL